MERVISKTWRQFFELYSAKGTKGIEWVQLQVEEESGQGLQVVDPILQQCPCPERENQSGK